jgi:hypothetical protein
MSESLFSQYINRRMSAFDLQNELKRLIRLYNETKGTYLLVYAVDLEKSSRIQGLNISLIMNDYQIIHELLRHINQQKLDLYLETPGGSGEAAEEIVNFLHRKFETVDFLIAGEAKSAGTLMAMSADEIYMTDSGSLGPIDAQVRIGRSVVSAFDYVKWIDDKRQEVENGLPLNAVDTAMLAQISPGEYMNVFHAQEFARDKLKEWLPKYKFKHWNETETRKMPVDKSFKAKRAEEIATKMINHAAWRSHGKSLKISDLEEIGLRIKRIDDIDSLCETVYRIKTVIKLLFGSSTHYKIFFTANENIVQSAVSQTPFINNQQNIQTPVVEINVNCPNCGKQHPLYAKLGKIPPVLEKQLALKSKLFPADNKIQCECGYTIDLAAIRNQLENQLGRKIVD